MAGVIGLSDGCSKSLNCFNNCNENETCQEGFCILNINCTSNENCSDGLFCNGEEICVNGFCQSGFINCSSNNTLISTCSYNPDNNPLTFDFYSFISSCNEILDSCSSAPINWEDLVSHTCNLSCDAQCIQDSDCSCPTDTCIGEDYYDYPNNGSCSSCNCNNITDSGGNCEPTIIPDDSRCIIEGIEITTCQELDEQNQIYTLTSNIINNTYSFV